jgi:hypothetical protein
MRSKWGRRSLVALLLLFCAAGVAEGLGADAVAGVCLVVLVIVCPIILVVGYAARARRERQR